MAVTSGKAADRTPQETKGIPGILTQAPMRKFAQTLARSCSNQIVNNAKSIDALFNSKNTPAVMPRCGKQLY